MAHIAPSDYVRVGEPVLVIFTDQYGPTRIVRKNVAKINAYYFTVEDVDTPGAQSRPVQFRNRLDMGHRTFGENCHQTARGDIYVAQDLPEVGDPVRAGIRVRKAARRIGGASRAWEKVDARRTGHAYTGDRPGADEIDAALVEIIESAVAMRQALGLPGEEG